MWARIDDHFYLNPKNTQIDRDEQDLFLVGNTYCNLELTDGYIPAGKLLTLMEWAKIPCPPRAKQNRSKAEAIASRLVQHGYWEAAAGGYRVHDFLDWNRSKEQIVGVRDRRAEAGRRGGQRSGAARRGKSGPNKANSKQLLHDSFEFASKQNEANSNPEPYRLVGINPLVNQDRTNQPPLPPRLWITLCITSRASSCRSCGC